MKCIIVADGPSAKGFIPPDGVPIISVKGSIDWLTRADYWFSLDPNERTTACMMKKKEGVQYFCACPSNVSIPPHVTRFNRISRRGLKAPPPDTPEWWIWRWSAVLGLNKNKDCINSGNSAYGALGLAYHLGFTDVLLVGVDGTSEPRVSDNKAPNNLSHLPILFESALPQIAIQTISVLGKIKQTTLEEWLKQ